MSGQYSELKLSAADSTELFVRYYASEIPASNRNLVIVHGMSEHGGRYEHVARFFAQEGWNVIVGDQRGHGQSGGVRTHVDRFEQFLTDLDTIWDHFQFKAEQTALLGHSMGSLVSIRFAETRPDKMSVLVALAPLLGLKVVIHPFTILLGRFVSLFAPRTRFESRVDPADTTRCPEAIQKRADDPLIHRSVTAGCYFALKRAMKAAWREASKIQLPLLVMQGDLDRIVDPAVVEPWLETVSSEDRSLVRFSEHLHELHNEPDWVETMTQVADWLNQRLPIGEPASDATPAAV